MSDAAFTVLAIGWLAFWITASVVYRLKKGQPLWPSPPANADFVERGVSGWSLRNVFTRIGGARNCLLVYIAEGELVITPTFPFNLAFLPELYGVDYRVPVGTIADASLDPQWGGKSTVRLTFKGDELPPVELTLANAVGFLARLAGH